MQADFAGDQIDFLVVIFFQIDDAVLAEARDGRAGLGVERDQPVAGRDVEDALFLAVGPISEAAAGKLARRGLAALAFVLAMHPEHLAGGGIQRDHGAARSGGGIETPLTISGVASN